MKNIARYKKYVINTLIFSLIVAALVAVVSVIIGSFNDTSQKIIWILASVVTHALVGIALIERSEDKDGGFTLFRNTLYALVPISILTSTLGIATVISPSITGSLYQLYLVAVCASLYSNLLQFFKGATKLIDRISISNIFFICLTAVLLIPQILLDNPRINLGDFYYRILAAAGIVDITLTILTLLYYKIYAQHNPDAKLLTKHIGKNKVWVWVLIAFITLQVLPMLIYGLASLFTSFD